MNKITIVAKNKQTYFIRRLEEEFGKENLILVDPWSDRWEELNSGPILCRTFGVYRCDRDLELLGIHAKNAQLVNPLQAIRLFRSKVDQYSYYDQIDVPLLPWLNLNSTSVEQLHSFHKKVDSKLYLIKPDRGQGGRGIKVFDFQEILHWWEYSDDLDYVLQPYVDTKEIRYFFIGEHFSVTLERLKIHGQAAANFRAEGEAKVISEHQEVLQIIERIKLMVPIHYGAVDILLLPSGPVVLEVNAVPGIEQLEQITRLNIMQILIKSLEFK